MSNSKEDIITRYLKDTENKTESIWKKAYHAGRNDGYAEAKEKGIAEAWETVRKIAEMPYEDFCGLFHFESLADIVRFQDPDTVMSMLKEYESQGEETKLEVGDEVMDENGLIGIITNADTHYHIYYKHNGKTRKAPKDAWLTRTGRKCHLYVGYLGSATIVE